MLINRRDPEIRKDHSKNENIIHCQGFLNNKARQELQSQLLSQLRRSLGLNVQIKQSIKNESQTNPEHRPESRFTEAHHVGFFMKDTQI
ncbi:hypothetical protein D3C87_1867310 [compost metagenome]